MLSHLLHFASTLKFQTLFLISLGLFVFNLLVPDPIPFVDELLLGLATLMLSTWKKRPAQQRKNKRDSAQHTSQPHNKTRGNNTIDGEFTRLDD